MASISLEQSEAPNKNHSQPRKLLHLITNALKHNKISAPSPTNSRLLKRVPMDAVASSSSSSDRHYQPYHHHHPRYKPTEPVAERIVRALRHGLLLLHRADSIFFVLGATGNVYTVTLSSTSTCTCPDRTTPCKHILFVYIRVLGLSPDDVCISRRTLRPCQLIRLLKMPTKPDAVAGENLRERFHQQYLSKKQGVLTPIVEIAEGTTCPVCLEEIGREERVVACGTCRNPIHEECLMGWKRSRGSRSVCCVICRARWRERTKQQDKYLNLAAYISEEEANDGNGIGSNVVCGRAVE